MKKGLFTLCFAVLVSLFMTSCNDENLSLDSTPDPSAASQTPERNYVFAMKTSNKNKSATRAVGVDTKKYWSAGETIRVKFLNGTSVAQQRTQEYAKIWEKYAYLTFEFVGSGEEADVKIVFGSDGNNLSWSYIGTDCQDYDQSEATMQLINFTDELLDDKTTNGDTREDFRAIVLRQFGHVLGLGFEHQNPDSDFVYNIDYDRAEAYLVRQGWPDYDIAEMLEVYGGRRVDAGTFDENSIMMLYFPSYLTYDGKAGKWNLSLSKGDMKFVGKIYPFPKTKLEITYAQEGHANSYPYEAIRVGEYLWMDCNLYAPSQYIPSRAAIDKGLTRIGADPSSYQVSLADFNRYFGTYYARDTWGIDGRIAYPTVYEYNRNGDRVKVEGWGMDGDQWDQLFAMCGTGSKAEIKKYLGAKIGDNPCAYNPTGANWFTGNENIYGFNLMPGSSLFNGPQSDGRTGGDFDRLFEDDRYVGYSRSHIVASTYNHARLVAKLWHWMHVRYSRRLTDQELGYKLYINAAKTDIVQKTLTDPIPSGYTELANGYLRGFYVQYILDNPTPEKTIAQIVAMSNKMTNDLFY